ncbi:MAG: hypothetical protein J2P23_15980 [Microlunatus sp.]|nr:hypothetical protein [Microlunatus sp.]
MDQKEKVREIRLRRAAERRGLLLVKSRRRDPGAIGYGLYVLVKDVPANRKPMHGGQAAQNALNRGEGKSLDEIEEEINSF